MKENFKEIIYISELNLPNISAQSLQTLKMCSAFAQKKKTKLLVFYSNKNFDFYRKNFILKNSFKINGIFKNPKKHTLLNRLCFFFKIFNLLRLKKNTLFVTRSVLVSSLFALFGIKNILEIHLENYGFTKFFFNLKMFFIGSKNQKYILISKKLNEVFKFDKKDFTVLDDASDFENFDTNKKNKIKINSCVYTGSFFKGKGVEMIFEISKKMQDVKFFLYGNYKSLSVAQKNDLPKNIFLCGHISYSKIPDILSKHKICLMPYSKKAFIDSGKISNEKYISPLKLFDYLSSGKVLVASNLPVYNHILKNKKNCFLVKSNKVEDWITTINYIFKNYNRLDHIRKSAKQTAKFYNWNKRAQNVISFSKSL